jgi:mannose-6-phosphate isomerase-like protein (cupin superfamily)
VLIRTIHSREDGQMAQQLDAEGTDRPLDARVDAVHLPAAAAGLTGFWSQRVIGEANGTLLKVAKGIGETRWHHHGDQDETFLVLRGRLRVQLRDRDVDLEPGDLFVVPKGVEHCPVAHEETHFLILGTSVTSNAAGGKPEWSVDGGAPGE